MMLFPTNIRSQIMTKQDQNSNQKINQSSSHSSKKRTTLTTQELTETAMLSALALALSWLESIIPFQPGLPGVKLGLANLVIVFCLYRRNVHTALLVNIVRICLAGAMFNGLWGTLYSLSGAALSLAAMAFLMYINQKRTNKGKTEWFSIFGVSMTGGVFHNVGQLLIAMLAISNLNLIYYGAVLILSGIATGIVNGILAYVLLKYIPRYYQE